MARYLRFIVVFFVLVSIAHAGPQTASSTTGANLILRARVYLDESTALKWSDATLLQFLNDGMVDIAEKSLCYQATESVNLVANTVEYTPAANFISIVAVMINPASGISWGLKKSNITKRASDTATDFDTPEFWYEFAGKVGIYPAYSSVTTETATLYMAVKPATITSGQNVVTPAVFDRALVYYIVGQAFAVDRRFAEAGNFINLYMQEIDRYRLDFVGADSEKTDAVR